MEGDKKAIARMLGIPEEKVEIDRYSYATEFPDEIKAWKFIGKNDPACAGIRTTSITRQAH